MLQITLYIWLILGLLVSGQQQSNIVSDVEMPASSNNVEQIDELFSEFDDIDAVVDKLSKLDGKWPFRDVARCDYMQTRDTDYQKVKHQQVQPISRVSNCGLTLLSNKDNRIASVSSRRARRQRRYIPQRKDDLVEKLDSLLDQLIEQEDSRKKTKNHSYTSRVVGGEITADGAWPWLAAVGLKSSGPKCGGSLIADRWVLTAAHCFQDEEMPCRYNVRVGSKSWFYDVEGTHADVTIDAIYRHPNYDEETHANDVALLRLSKPVRLNKNSYINAVCLPSHSQSVQPGTICIAAGWGKTEETSKASVFESRQVKLPVISYRDKCGSYNHGTIQPGMLCAGYLEGGRDTCQGDSGGPLVYKSDGRWTILGLTSFGNGCARANYPGIYTDVGYHLEWIASVIRRFN